METKDCRLRDVSLYFQIQNILIYPWLLHKQT